MENIQGHKRKTIFLTGATGFVGRHLAVQLLALGYRLILLVRPKRIDPWKRVRRVISEAIGYNQLQESVWENVHIVIGDITERNLSLSSSNLDLVRQADATIHCAALVSFEDKKKELERCNVIGTERVVDLLKQIACPELHYISTAFVSGYQRGQVLEEASERPLEFNNWYEETKFLAEQLVISYSKTHRETVIYRPGIIVGRFADGFTTSFGGFYRFLAILDTFFRQIQTRATNAAFINRFVGIEQRNGYWHIPIRVPGRLEKTVNLVPIDFVTQWILAIFHDSSSFGKIHHLVNQAPPTIGGIKEVVDNLYGVQGVTLITPEKFESIRITPLESLFLATTHRYLFYLKNPEPRFVDTNAQKILQKRGIFCPQFDRAAIERLIEFARHSFWGREVR